MADFKDSAVVAVLTTLAKPTFAVRQWLGRRLGDVLWYSRSRSRQVTLRNLELCFPEWSQSKRRSFAHERLREVGATTLEMANFWISSAEQNMARVNKVYGDVDVHSALQEQGVILLGPHIGNWECAALYLTSLNKTVFSMYKPNKNQQLEDLILAGRQSTGVNLVPTNRRGVMKLVKGLRDQQLIGILPDQEPPLGSGVFAPFFGIQTLTMSLVANLLAKYDAQVFWIYALPEGEGFNIHITPASEGIYAKDTELSAAALNADVEKIARSAPEMYQWEYKRFKRRPNNEARFY